jgi:hypothetical protein
MTWFNLSADWVSIAIMLKKLKLALDAFWICNNDHILELDLFEL